MASNHKFQSPRYAYQNPFTGIDRSKHSNSFYRVIFGRLTRETIPRSFSNEQTSSLSVGKRCRFCCGKILLRTTRKFQTSAAIWGNTKFPRNKLNEKDSLRSHTDLLAFTWTLHVHKHWHCFSVHDYALN